MSEWNPDRLREETFLCTICLLEETASTNSDALAWAPLVTSEELPAIVIAERQTGGRGRGSNQWHSSTGALTCSLVIAPSVYGIAQSRWPALSVTTGSSVAAALEDLVPEGEVRLKWPNDVFARGHKIAGILVEVPPRTEDRVVVGVGINVRNSLAEAPMDVRARGVSLVELTTPAPSREEVLIRFLKHFHDQLLMLGRSDPALPARWRTQCLLTGRQIHVTGGRDEVWGTCLGLDDDGALRVGTAGGERRLYSGIVEAF